MNLQHIELESLTVASLNVRKTGAKHTDDLVPSIRALGLLQPLLVRADGAGYEVVAGQRRFHALQKLSLESEVEPVPCIVMSVNDDAAAIEASLAENLARLPMDEIDQYKAFALMVKKGLDAGDIAAHFGITERLVHQRLAIANVISPILTAYKRQEIEPATLRLLTLATKKQQKDWLAIFKEQGEYGVPTGYALKQWLFGGSCIQTDNALFDLEGYKGAIVSDLFGEEAYFADSALFWEHQSTAIAAAKEAYLSDGWSDVVVLGIGEYFPSYDYVDTAKEDGGKVYIHISHDGQVTFYEGQLSRKAVKKMRNSEDGESKAERAEITKAMQNYLDLHRHSAVRTELLSNSNIALRLAVAQMIAGSELWSVHGDPRKAQSETIGESFKTNQAEDSFNQARQTVRGHLGMKGTTADTLVPCKGDWDKSHDLHKVFAKLMILDDEAVMQILTFVVAETLPSGSVMVEALGQLLSVDMQQSWEPGETFFSLLRDKEVVNAMLKQVAGKKIADAHITATAKVQKSLIQETLNTQEQSAQWMPKYMRFPMQSYTKRGGIRALDNWKAVKKFYT